MSKYYVYAHYRPNGGEIFYIGKGSGNRAWKCGKSIRNTHWHNIVQKHGGFDVEIIHEGLDLDLALMLECSYIQCYGKHTLGQGPLVNLTDGGEGAAGCNPSPTTRQKLRDAQKGKKYSDKSKEKMRKAKLGKIPWNKGIKLKGHQKGKNHFNYGKTHSDATREKMKENHVGMLGKRHTAKTKKKIGASHRRLRRINHA